MATFVARHNQNNRNLIEALSITAGQTLNFRNLPTDEAAWALLESEADLGLISPLLFGKRQSDIALLGGACVAAVGATGEWRLHFRQGLHSIDTLGIYGTRGMSDMLAEILLREKYGMQPRLHQVTGPAPQALAAVDAILTTSDEERTELDSSSSLDIIDEWFDMTQLPLVREVFIGWERRLDAIIDHAVRTAGEITDTEALHTLKAAMQGRGTENETEAIPSHFRYVFNDDAVEGLRTFFQMAFFYGLHPDIPDLLFWMAEE
ncbi:MAG: hypothetical protein KFH87_01070 [Bacteroidetes bacterium]|nr:hypothetical protein [Bacteroidota bacterium]